VILDPLRRSAALVAHLNLQDAEVASLVLSNEGEVVGVNILAQVVLRGAPDRLVGKAVWDIAIPTRRQERSVLQLLRCDCTTSVACFWLDLRDQGLAVLCLYQNWIRSLRPPVRRNPRRPWIPRARSLPHRWSSSLFPWPRPSRYRTSSSCPGVPPCSSQVSPPCGSHSTRSR
jgi:hypothetical protein